ncbi:MAG TPA: hypothetical protein VHX14_05020 [Thermoanaerobaculia bacterium]|nr:hypothetical protein [Thermoanaerobaculia bacterium]
MRTKAQQAGGLATSALILFLAASGCSTNHTPGDGQPAMTPPATPSSTPGSSSGTSGNPPMTSAYSSGANVDRAEEAAAIMASHQGERYLGPIDPAGVQSGPTPPTGQFIPPSATANPEVTVNASISSPPTPVVISGPDGDAGVFIGAVGTSATGAASVGATNNPTLITPTTAAMTATPGQFAAGPAVTQSNIAAATTNTSLSPTMSSAAIPSPNQANSVAGTTIANIGTSSGLTQTPTMSSAAVPSPNQAANNTAGATIANSTTTANRTTLTPAMSSAAIPSPNVAANLSQRTVTATTSPVIVPATSPTRATSVATGSLRTGNAAIASSSTAKISRTARGRVTLPVRVVSNTNGTLTVTNVSTPPVVIQNKQ